MCGVAPVFDCILLLYCLWEYSCICVLCMLISRILMNKNIQKLIKRKFAFLRILGTSKCCNSFLTHSVVERVCLKSGLTTQLWNGILTTLQHYIKLVKTRTFLLRVLNFVHWSAPKKLKGKHNYVFCVQIRCQLTHCTNSWSSGIYNK